MLGDELNAMVQEYITNVCKDGGVINRKIVIAAARGIVMYHDRSLLTENGGHIELTCPWSESLMKRMNFVRRKCTRAARNKPIDFQEVETASLQQISDVAQKFNIPDCLIVNIDQTGVDIIPASD